MELRVKTGCFVGNSSLFVAAALLIAYTQNAFACSVGRFDFRPTFEPFQWKLGVGSADRERWAAREAIPAPVVKVVSIDRGPLPKKNVTDSCDFTGVIRLSVTLPPQATYAFDQFGVYFRVLRGKMPMGFLPDQPLKNPVRAGEMEIGWLWTDAPPDRHSPIDLTIEAFFVTNDLRIGPSTTFEVKG